MFKHTRKDIEIVIIMKQNIKKHLRICVKQSENTQKKCLKKLKNRNHA